MKRELMNSELERVNGGTVIVTDSGVVGFSTLGEMYDLHGVSWTDARSYAEDLLDQNPQKTDREFDEMVRDCFKAKGWI